MDSGVTTQVGLVGQHADVLFGKAATLRAPLRDVTNLRDSFQANVKEAVSDPSIIKEFRAKLCDIKHFRVETHSPEIPSSQETNVILELDTDQLCEGEYSKEIYESLFELEEKNRANPNYISRQRDINQNMRAILVDWLVEVVEEYRLTTDTLYLTINLVDRFLSTTHITREKLQLVGVASMLIASKFEEITPPLVEEFVYICDSSYTRLEILTMERMVLKALKFDICYASCRHFTPRFVRAIKGDERTEHLTNYLTELTLQEYGFLRFSSSIISVCALTIALDTQGLAFWNVTLEYYSNYSAEELAECLAELHRLYIMVSGSNLQAVREKYAGEKYLFVTRLTPRPSPPVFLPATAGLV